MMWFLLHRGDSNASSYSAGCRYANCLDKDPSRIATAIFCSFVIPGGEYICCSICVFVYYDIAV